MIRFEQNMRFPNDKTISLELNCKAKYHSFYIKRYRYSGKRVRKLLIQWKNNFL